MTTVRRHPLRTRRGVSVRREHERKETSPTFNVRFSSISDEARRKARESVVEQMKRNRELLPDWIESEDVSEALYHEQPWWIEKFGTKRSKPSTKINIAYLGHDGEEASRVIYATGGIPYTLVDDERGGWGFSKGWRWANNLGEYAVVLPASVGAR